jgi:hypothetical protein
MPPRQFLFCPAAFSFSAKGIATWTILGYDKDAKI